MFIFTQKSRFGTGLFNLCEYGSWSTEICNRIKSATEATAILNSISEEASLVSWTSSSCTSLLSLPFSSLSVRHGPCLLILWKGSTLSKPKAWEKKKTSPHLLIGAQDQRINAERDQLPCGLTRTASGNCQETEIRFIRAFTWHNSLSKINRRGASEGGRHDDRHRCVCSFSWRTTWKDWTPLP